VDIVTAFSRAGARTIATDANPLAPAPYHADERELVPRVDDPAYVPTLAQLVREHDVAVIVPLTDLDHITLARAREALKPNGTLMIVEPSAGDTLEENLTSVGRIFYGASTMLCTPASLSQEVGLALGAQAGGERMREVVKSAGFSEFRRATQTPFNMVYEARP
jgi:hypothetical protein